MPGPHCKQQECYLNNCTISLFLRIPPCWPWASTHPSPCNPSNLKMPPQRRCAHVRLPFLLSLDSAYLHAHRQNLFKISTRDAHLHLSTRDAHLHISTRDAHLHISTRDADLHLSALDKISHPSDSTPEKKLGPRYLATHQIPSRKCSGPDTDPTQGKTRAPTIGPHSTQEETRARVVGGKFPGYRSPVSHQSSCPNLPLSLSSLSSPCYSLASFLCGRYRLGLTSIASCCRSLRESLWGLTSVPRS